MTVWRVAWQGGEIFFSTKELAEAYREKLLSAARLLTPGKELPWVCVTKIEVYGKTE